jgi:hypothetical protein
MQRVIICAANRNHQSGQVVLGIRHWDSFMVKFMDTDVGQVDQGFIDNKGNFLSRTEAWKVADEAGQIRRHVGGDATDGGTLYSENLY